MTSPTSTSRPAAISKERRCHDHAEPTRPGPDRRALLQRQIRPLAAATIIYNVIEAAVAITAGSIASSAALINFGLDSVVEVASAAAVADSKQALLCTYLSAILLMGLALNSLFGWSWADPIAALVIAAVAVKEGHEAWRGDACCAPNPLAASPSATPGSCFDGCCASDREDTP